MSHNFVKDHAPRARSFVLSLLCLFCLMAQSVSAQTTYTAIVMRTALRDKPPVKTKAQINDMMFDSDRSAKRFYENASFGQATWTGVVIDVSVPFYSTDGSSWDDWADAAENAARAQGYEPRDFTSRITMIDTDAGSTEGIESGGRIIMFSTGNIAATVHEMGHSLNMGHAGTDLNNDGAIDSAYGDISDVMGGGAYTFNAPHKVFMGWMSATNITANGTYTVTHTQATSGTRAFRYYPPTGDPYYFSYRQPVGYDATTTWSDGQPKSPIGAPFTNGLNIHRFGSRDPRLVREPLKDGVSYTIPGTSVVIRQISHNSTSTTFTVSGVPATSATLFSGPGTYRLTPFAASGSALEVPGFSKSNGRPLSIWSWNNGANQKFNVIGLGDGLYRIQAVHDLTKSLDALGSGDNAPVGIWQQGDGPQQKWRIMDVGGGWYSLVPENAPTKAMDNSNGSAANGNSQVLWSFSSSSNNQKWRFTRVE